MNGDVGTELVNWTPFTVADVKTVKMTIGTKDASTTNTDSLGNLQLVGKLSLAVATGALLN